MTIYSKELEKFQIIDYSATHSQLLLRSLKTKERKYNIDVLVKGVSHMLIPTTLNGIEISVLDDAETISFLESQYYFNQNYGKIIYCIKDGNKGSYFVNALCLAIYHNNLDILETSLGRYDMGNLGELQLWHPG